MNDTKQSAIAAAIWQIIEEVDPLFDTDGIFNQFANRIADEHPNAPSREIAIALLQTVAHFALVQYFMEKSANRTKPLTYDTYQRQAPTIIDSARAVKL